MNQGKEVYLNTLKQFKTNLIKYNRTPTSALRTEINKSIAIVTKLTVKAGTTKRISIAPPPMMGGGYVLNNVDPLTMLFDAPYGIDLTQVIIDIIDSTIGFIEDDEQFDLSTNKEKEKKQVQQLQVDSKKVFIVHGHDNEMLQTVARYLEKCSIEPIILHEQTSNGRTIIEKFEQHSNVPFAIVLLSPDDVGRSISDDPADLNYRARQNVIFELGYFIGKLGRTHVCALLKGSLETPSDYDGIVYLQFDQMDGWKLLLAKEMKQAGLSIDLNKVF